jgi:hypothetical protein
LKNDTSQFINFLGIIPAGNHASQTGRAGPIRYLHDELRYEIFSLALHATRQPRVVEIFFKDGEIYSQTRPPPLLQVCQLSRYVTLKYYKPWLPMFKGRKSHRPWRKLLESEDLEKLSRLQNVCIDFRHDMLFINRKQWPNWDFGFLEQMYLPKLAINWAGWQAWTSIPDLVGQFKKLKLLYLFDDTQTLDSLLFKGGIIEKRIAKNLEKRKVLEYTGPSIQYAHAPSSLTWETHRGNWITYKYTKGFKLTSASRLVSNSEDEGNAVMPTSSEQAKRYRYSHPSKKRPHSSQIGKEAAVKRVFKRI